MGRSLYNRLEPNTPAGRLSSSQLFYMESSAMRLQHLGSSARVFAMACVLAVTSTSAFAQSGQFHINMATLDAAAQSAAQQPTETVKRLSIDDAVRSALEQNLGIRIQRIDPQIQDIGVMQARSFWAPSLSSSLSRQLQTQQSTSALSGSLTSLNNTS